MTERPLSQARRRLVAIVKLKPKPAWTAQLSTCQNCGAAYLKRPDRPVHCAARQ
jgi:hypothetical protein